MKRFSIYTTQALTSEGKLGAWLFILSPLAGGGFYFWFVVETLKRYGGTPALPAILLIASGLAFSGGAVLLLIGRTFKHDMREMPAQPESSEVKGLWS